MYKFPKVEGGLWKIKQWTFWFLLRRVTCHFCSSFVKAKASHTAKLVSKRAENINWSGGKDFMRSPHEHHVSLHSLQEKWRKKGTWKSKEKAEQEKGDKENKEAEEGRKGRKKEQKKKVKRQKEIKNQEAKRERFFGKKTNWLCRGIRRLTLSSQDVRSWVIYFITWGLSFSPITQGKSEPLSKDCHADSTK